MAEEQQVAEAPVETGQATSGDWKASLPQDIQDHQLISNIDNVETLAKTAIHSQSMIGADKVVIPGKWANDTDWDNVYTKLGKPEAAEKYELQKENGVAVDKDIEGWYKGIAHEAGLNNTQANKIFKAYLERTAEAEAANAPPSVEAIEVKKSEAELSLKKEWGKAFDQKIGDAKNILTQFAPEGFDTMVTQDGIPLGNHPEFVKTLANIGSYIKDKIGEDKIVGDRQPQEFTPADAEAEIAKLRGDPRDKGPYWNKSHVDHQRTVEEVSRLMEYMYPDEQ